MRILIVSQFFQPEPFVKGVPFARELMRRGHQVEVLTGFPHYPGGKLYDGYKIRMVQRESIDGIPVYRVPIYPSHDRSGLKRTLTYASFMSAAATIGLARTALTDVVYIYHPPMTTGLVGAVFRILRHVPFVLDINDLWPDTLAATGMVNNKSVLQVVGLFAKAIYSYASRVVVVSNGFKDALIDRGVPPEKLTVIHNWSLEGEPPAGKDPELAARLDLDGCFVVLFAGNLGLAQGLDTVLDAAALVKDDAPSVRFVLMGAGVEGARLRQRAETEGLANIRFLGWRPSHEAYKIMAIADALLVHLKDEPLFRITIPSKTQAYLSAGRPIIMAVRGDAARMVHEANAGLIIEPQAPEQLAEAVRTLARIPLRDREAFGLNGKAYYERALSLQIGVTRFERVFDEAVTVYRNSNVGER